MNITDGETLGGDGLPGPAPRKHQGKQRKARGSGRGASGGPGFANVPPDLQLEFNWFFNEVLADAPSASVSAPAVPHWKSVIIRTIGNMLHALMIFGVSYTVVTHVGQHNSNGSHKTAQAEGSTRRADRATTETRNLKTDVDGAAPDGVLPDGQCKPFRPSWMDEIKAMLSEVRAGVVGLVAAAGGSTTGNLPKDQAFGENKKILTIGRFQYGAEFHDVWLSGEHYDLRGRAKARFCLQYLVAKQAFDPDSARHLENEIDPFVRKKCQIPQLPESAQSNLRIQHFFNDPSQKLSRLRRELVKAAGRNGRFYLQVG